MQINKTMQSQNNMPSTTAVDSTPARRPNEAAAFCVHGFVRIFDPETKQTIVEVRS